MGGKFSNIFKRESVQDITFRKVFGVNSEKVVSNNNECHHKLLHVRGNVDYIP